jgi:hypothetical protein
MIRKLFLSIIILGLLSSLHLYGQTPVDVAESTLKVGIMGEEIFYFGFAEGDQLIFNFEETNGKELKELEITETPSTSVFLDYKTKKITNKIINIPRTGIYKFRFTNSSIGVRICKYKIQRIPASRATENFNPIVYWHMVDDTTYTTVEEQYLSKTDTVIVNFQDRVVKVNPISAGTGNKATSNFLLPENTIAWSFYLYTDKAGQQAYEEANKTILSSSAASISKFPMYNVLAAVAIGRPATITKLQTGEDIDYWIMEGDNVNLFTAGSQFRYIKKGKAVNDYARMEHRKGNLYFCFSNDNATAPVTVTVKITVVQVNEMLDTRPAKRMIITQKNKMYLKN